MKRILLSIPREYRDHVKDTPKGQKTHWLTYPLEQAYSVWRPLYRCDSLDDLSKNRDMLVRRNAAVALRSLDVIDKKQTRVGIVPISNMNRWNYYSLELALADPTGVITLNYAFTTKTQDEIENTSLNVKDPLVFAENGDSLEIFVAQLEQGRLRIVKPWHVRNDHHYERTKLL